MAASILEQIAVKILAKLETVTVANGYEVTLTSPVRPTRDMDNYSPLDKAVVLDQSDPPERFEEEDIVGNPPGIAWRQVFSVWAFVSPSDAATSAVDTEINAIRSSIEKALMSNRTWDALAIDTRLGEPAYFNRDDGAFAGIVVRAGVIYRVSEDDPYTNRAGA